MIRSIMRMTPLLLCAGVAVASPPVLTTGTYTDISLESGFKYEKLDGQEEARSPYIGIMARGPLHVYKRQRFLEWQVTADFAKKHSFSYGADVFYGFDMDIARGAVASWMIGAGGAKTQSRFVNDDVTGTHGEIVLAASLQHHVRPPAAILRWRGELGIIPWAKTRARTIDTESKRIGWRADIRATYETTNWLTGIHLGYSMIPQNPAFGERGVELRGYQIGVSLGFR